MVDEVAAREQRLKKAEEALRRSERHFRALIEKGQDIIALLDAKGVVRYQSPSVQQVLGYNPVEMVGKRTIDFVHPEDRERVLETRAQALAEPEGAATA